MVRRWVDLLPMNRTMGLGILIAGLLSAPFCVLLDSPAQAAAPHNSRLSQLVKHKPSVYMPSRLVIGTDNHFTIQGPPGANVIIYLSSESQGLEAPDGQPLRVGKDNQQLTGTVPENGVLELSLPVPEEPGLVGKQLFVEGILWQAENYGDLTVLDMMDATGRRTGDNVLAITKPASGKGAMIMPTMPGIPPTLMRQLTNLSAPQASQDPQKNQLIQNGGQINRDLKMDKNVFFNRQGQFPQQ